MSDEYKIVSIYDDDPSKSLPNVGVVDMDSRLPIHKGDDDYNATVQQLADAIHKPEIVEGSMTTDIIRKNTIFFLKNNETTINLTLSAAKITVLEGTDIVESSDKAAGFIVIAVNGSTKVHNVIYGTTSWELPSEKAMGFVWSGSTWTVASIDVESIVSAVGEFTQLTVSNLTVTEVIEGEAVDNAINAKLAMYTPLETVIPLYRVFDANAAVGVLQLPRILDKTWSVPRGSANLPPQESDYRIEFKSRYLVGGTSQSIQIAYATDEENPNVYCRGCKYDAETERWSFGDWKELITNTQLATTLESYPTKTEVENKLENYLNSPKVYTFSNNIGTDTIIHLGSLKTSTDGQVGITIEMQTKRADGSTIIQATFNSQQSYLSTLGLTKYSDIYFYKTDTKNFDIYIKLGSWCPKIYVKVTNDNGFTYDGKAVTSFMGELIDPIKTVTETDLVNYVKSYDNYKVGDETDLNKYLTSGFYRIGEINDYTNVPSGATSYSQLIVSRNGDTVAQLFLSWNVNKIFFRCRGVNNVSIPWVEVTTEKDLLNIPITYKTNANDCIPTESGKKSTFCVLAGGENLPTTSGTGHYIIESVRAKTTGGVEFVIQNAINFDNNTMYIRRAVYNGSLWPFNAWK